MTFTPEFQSYVSAWKNENEYNQNFHTELTDKVNADLVLKEHRDFVEDNQYGFGDRPFSYVWKMLVDQMPTEFSFLEVGVFKGQVISLIALLAKQRSKVAHVYGVTTLTNTRDVRCQYPAGDYAKWIADIHDEFKVPQPKLFVGKSSDTGVLECSMLSSPYEILYIDGNHDLHEVVMDIKNYALMTKLRGYLVMDDASIGRLNIGNLWPGLEEVAQAVKDHLDNDPRFKFLLCVGHLNVFQRIA
jgi:hypothetical protein